jgi:hypothetical protein
MASWERMVESPGQSGASRAADGSAGTSSGKRWPVPAAPGRSRPPGERLGWGRLPARAGVLIVVAAAALGAAWTVASDRDPGRALGAFVLAGTLAAATSVRAQSAYAIIPVPALAYAAAGVAAGSVHDHAVDATRTALAVSAVQWIAGGFTAMIAATALAVLITLARWLLRLRTAR